MSKKRVLVINLGWEQEPLLQELASREMELYGVHYDESYSRDVAFSEVLICDLRDLAAILSFAERIKAEAVVSDQCDYSSFAQAVVAERMGLPGPGVKQAQVATNKLLQREKAREAGLTIPEFQLCLSQDDVEAFGARVGYPIIAKPVDNRGSFGVNKISSKDEVSAAYFDALVNSHSRLVIAEKFINGVHITIDGYAFRRHGCKSLTLATKELVGTQRQVAMDILYPGRMAADMANAARRENEKVNTGLGFTFGMTHSEYMVTDAGEVYLIESANRGGGVFTSEVIVPASSGVNVVIQYVDDVLGLDTDMYSVPAENKVLLKFFSFKPGKVKTITLPESITNNVSVLKHRVALKAGAVISEITTDANRHGFIILASENDIEAVAEQIVSEITVEYEDG
jgi:biotin carboxylase